MTYAYAGFEAPTMEALASKLVDWLELTGIEPFCPDEVTLDDEPLDQKETGALYDMVCQKYAANDDSAYHEQCARYTPDL